MARRKSKRKTTRRRTKSFNILNAAEALAMWQLTTTNLMGIGGLDFFTAGTQFNTRISSSGYTSGKTGGYHSNVITAMELIGMKQNSYKTNFEAISENAKANFAPLIVGAIGIPIAFRFGKQITSKPRRMANNLLKMAGVKELKV